MRLRTWRTCALVLVALVTCVFLPGCSDPNEPEQKPEDIVNPDNPSSNAQILSHTAIGETGKWTVLSEMTDSHTGGYYFRGGYNSQYVCGRLNASGNVTWHCRTHYWPRDLCVTAQTAVVPNALVVIGSHDNDSDGTTDTGYLSLVSASGSLLDEIVYSSDASDIWLTSIVAASDSMFVGVGGIKTTVATYPYFVLAKLASSGQLEKVSDVSVTALPGSYFGYAARDPGASSAGEVVLYVNSGPDVAAVHKLSLSLPTLDPWTVVWSREITIPSYTGPWVNGLCSFDGNLYVVGGVNDPDKMPPPSNDDHWKSATAASFTSAGVLRWTKVVSVTQHSEVFYGVTASAAGVFALGECASFFQQDQRFGYGWICNLSASTGGVVSSSTFGDIQYRSGFNTAIVDGAVIHCGGWTQEEVADVYRGWFCDVNFSGLAESPTIVPARIGADDQVIREDRPGGTRGGR